MIKKAWILQFGGDSYKVNSDIGFEALEHGPNGRRVADVDLVMGVAVAVLRQALQRRRISRIGELVDVRETDRRIVGQPIRHEVEADEPGPAGEKDAHQGKDNVEG